MSSFIRRELDRKTPWNPRISAEEYRSKVRHILKEPDGTETCLKVLRRLDVIEKPTSDEATRAAVLKNELLCYLS